MDRNQKLDSTQKVSIVVKALNADRLEVRAQDEPFVRELLALRRGVTGLLDISALSPEALTFAQVAASAVVALDLEMANEHSELALPVADAQRKLFWHYDHLFLALTGTSADRVSSVAEIKARMLERLRRRDTSLVDDFNFEAEALAQFYRENSISLFRAAKSLAGVKVVSGGQRQFVHSALTATRIAGLYCDTQLIPDPVYPFMVGDLHLNALHLQLAINLFHLLPLRPLTDVRPTEPPILVFPSFEEPLEENDAVTQAGIASLVMKVIAPVCDSHISTIEELFDYAKTCENAFLNAITRERLFIPPGVIPENVGSAENAADIYLKELQGVRSQNVVNELARLPRGVLVLNGILERLRPQYHLIENATELEAQPLLSQPAHWYYFERCSQAENRELVKQKVLSQEAFGILRALQDDSLAWLANIPITGLVELRQRMEHADLREHLKAITAQLESAGPIKLEEVVREVRHGLEVLIQRQQRAIKDIRDRYSPKIFGAASKSIIGAMAGASMFFLPSLAGITGVTAPMATALGALGAGGLTLVGEAVSHSVEKRKARRTMLGMFATARSK